MCHECRYCCTVSICTMEGGVHYYKFTNSSLKAHKRKEQMAGTPDAAHGFTTDDRMYKYYDFRCLKPKSGVDPTKWPYYEMKAYRAAKSEKELKKVKEIPFDKNFYNFEDPDAFHALTDANRGDTSETWKKTFGFDKTIRVRGEGPNADVNPCFEHCVKAEHSKWAKKCRKRGGFFKCCVYAQVFFSSVKFRKVSKHFYRTRLDQYQEIRYLLKNKDKLISKGPDKGKKTCGHDPEHGNCYHCHVTHVCAKKVTLCLPLVPTKHIFRNFRMT